MGERKGSNFYYPPDFDWKKHKSLDAYHGTVSGRIRERAGRLNEGILIIRFEMPFNVWCLGCGNHIGMGVRYNAEKTKVGMYYTTPLYNFHMKCYLCETWFDIRNDPKNFEYELVAGLRRQDKRPINVDGQLDRDREKGAKLLTDKMFKLEHGEEDKEKANAEKPKMAKLERMQGRMVDDFGLNQAARRRFRVEKKEYLKQKEIDEKLLEKSSLGDLKLLPETSDDKKLASMMIQYKTVGGLEQSKKQKRKDIINRSIFTKKTLAESLREASAAKTNKKLATVTGKRTKQEKLEDHRKSLSLQRVGKRKLQPSETVGPSTSSCTLEKEEQMNESELSSNVKSFKLLMDVCKEEDTEPKDLDRESDPVIISDAAHSEENFDEKKAVKPEVKKEPQRNSLLSLGDSYGLSSSGESDSD